MYLSQDFGSQDRILIVAESLSLVSEEQKFSFLADPLLEKLLFPIGVLENCPVKYLEEGYDEFDTIEPWKHYGRLLNNISEFIPEAHEYQAYGMWTAQRFREDSNSISIDKNLKVELTYTTYQNSAIYTTPFGVQIGWNIHPAIPDKRFDTVEGVESLCRRIIEVFRCDLLYVEIRPKPPLRTQGLPKHLAYLLNVAQMGELSRVHYNLSWRNFFSRRAIEYIGKEKFKTLKQLCSKWEETSTGNVFLETIPLLDFQNQAHVDRYLMIRKTAGIECDW